MVHTGPWKVLWKASCPWKVLENWRFVVYPWKTHEIFPRSPWIFLKAPWIIIAFIKKVFCTKEGLKAQQYVNFVRDHESVFSYNFGVPGIFRYLKYPTQALLRHHVRSCFHIVWIYLIFLFFDMQFPPRALKMSLKVFCLSVIVSISCETFSRVSLILTMCSILRSHCGISCHFSEWYHWSGGVWSHDPQDFSKEHPDSQGPLYVLWKYSSGFVHLPALAGILVLKSSLFCQKRRSKNSKCLACWAANRLLKDSYFLHPFASLRAPSSWWACSLLLIVWRQLNFWVVSCTVKNLLPTRKWSW